MAHALDDEHDELHPPRLVRTLRTPRLPPAQAEAQDQAARIAFIEVLLRFRERLIREGRLKP